MTERPRAALHRDADTLAIGPSSVRWDGDALVIDIAERGVPLPRAVRGQVRVIPEMMNETAFAFDPLARHRWHPIAPRARIEVALDAPDLRWQGDAYIDSNFGDEPLEHGFDTWQWSRAHLRDEVALFYEGTQAGGAPFELALRLDRQGNWIDAAPPPPARLLPTAFAMPRRTRADAGHRAHVLKTWEDAPFYSRSAIATHLYGEPVRAVHESLSLPRFRSPIVQRMLPYRMPRVLG